MNELQVELGDVARIIHWSPNRHSYREYAKTHQLGRMEYAFNDPIYAILLTATGIPIKVSNQRIPTSS